jgi:hypothetical protein
MILSWVRLLNGRFRDPLVGRDVLIGLTAGAGLVVLDQPGYLSRGLAVRSFPVRVRRASLRCDRYLAADRISPDLRPLGLVHLGDTSGSRGLRGARQLLLLGRARGEVGLRRRVPQGLTRGAHGELQGTGSNESRGTHIVPGPVGDWSRGRIVAQFFATPIPIASTTARPEEERDDALIRQKIQRWHATVNCPAPSKLPGAPWCRTVSARGPMAPSGNPGATRPPRRGGEDRRRRPACASRQILGAAPSPAEE